MSTSISVRTKGNSTPRGNNSALVKSPRRRASRRGSQKISFMTRIKLIGKWMKNFKERTNAFNGLLLVGTLVINASGFIQEVWESLHKVQHLVFAFLQ